MYAEFSMREILWKHVDGTSPRSSEMTVKKMKVTRKFRKVMLLTERDRAFCEITFTSVNKGVLGVLFNLKDILQCYKIQPLTVAIQTTPPNRHILNLILYLLMWRLW